MGKLISAKDVPKNCVTYKFEENVIVDYFTCKDCKINWVCNGCKDTCHADHNLVL